MLGAYYAKDGAQWTGASFNNPARNPAACESSLRWALAATMEADPTLMVTLLPDKAESGPSRWLQHPHVHCIDTIPKGSMELITPDFGGGCTSSQWESAKAH